MALSPAGRHGFSSRRVPYLEKAYVARRAIQYDTRHRLSAREVARMLPAAEWARMTIFHVSIAECMLNHPLLATTSLGRVGEGDCGALLYSMRPSVRIILETYKNAHISDSTTDRGRLECIVP